METFHLSFFAAPRRGMVGAVEDRTTTQVVGGRFREPLAVVPCTLTYVIICVHALAGSAECARHVGIMPLVPNDTVRAAAHFDTLPVAHRGLTGALTARRTRQTRTWQSSDWLIPAHHLEHVRGGRRGRWVRLSPKSMRPGLGGFRYLPGCWSGAGSHFGGDRAHPPHSPRPRGAQSSRRFSNREDDQEARARMATWASTQSGDPHPTGQCRQDVSRGQMLPATGGGGDDGEGGGGDSVTDQLTDGPTDRPTDRCPGAHEIDA